MSTRLAAIALFLLPPAALAGTQVFIGGGLSSVGFEQEDSPQSFHLEAERGGGLNLSGGVRFDNGLMLRASALGTSHDGGTLCVTGAGCGNFNEEIELGEFRLVALYAPKAAGTMTFELGGGIESLEARVDAFNFHSKADGLVLEGALIFVPSEAGQLELGIALMGLEDDDSGEDVGGAEFRLGGTLHFEVLDLGIMLRGIGLKSDDPDGNPNNGGDVETGVGELRITLGHTFDL